MLLSDCFILCRSVSFLIGNIPMAELAQPCAMLWEVQVPLKSNC